MKRAASFLIAVLTFTTLAACSDAGEDAAPTSSESSSSAPATSSAAPVEPNAALACGRFYNGGASSLNARVVAVVPVLEAQDAGTAPDEEQTEELAAIASALGDAITVSTEELAAAYTSIQDRVQGALDAAEAGGANAATLDYPTVSATIASECSAAGFPVS